MSDQDERQVRITGADIEAAGEKLRGFKQTLAPGEQAVIDWLLQRASEAPVADEEVSGYGFHNIPGNPVNPQFQSNVVQQGFHQALGMTQLNHLSPGQKAGISATVGIGVSF